MKGGRAGSTIAVIYPDIYVISGSGDNHYDYNNLLSSVIVFDTKTECWKYDGDTSGRTSDDDVNDNNQRIPDLPIPLFHANAVAFGLWIVVVGGLDHGTKRAKSSCFFLNTSSHNKQ